MRKESIEERVAKYGASELFVMSKASVVETIVTMLESTGLPLEVRKERANNIAAALSGVTVEE